MSVYVMDCSLSGSSVHGIFQARILEWVAIPFSRGSSWPRDQTQVCCNAGKFFTNWATREQIQFSFFWLRHGACGILVSWPGIKLRHLLHWKYSLIHWTARQVPSNLIFLTDITLLGLTHYLSEISNTCQDTHTHTHTHYYYNTKCPVGIFPHLN